MSNPSIKQVTVVGAGSMGHQIAMLAALGGFNTYLQDINEASLDKAHTTLQSIMSKWVQKGKITEEEKQAAFHRLSFTPSLEEAAIEADFVIEAVVEKLDVKREVFAQIDELAPPHAVVATNSSTIVSSLIADATNRSDRVCNMHFFYPPLVMDCVEVVQGEHTSSETLRTAMELCRAIHRTPVQLDKEISGFIANRILFAIQKEAMYLYENGYADYTDIDTITKKALSHPLGPFELMDLSGIDVGYYVMQQHFAETGNPEDKPSETMVQKMKAGELGRKTGKGFYVYDEAGKVKR